MHRLMGYLRIILPCAAMFACSHGTVDAASFWGIGEMQAMSVCPSSTFPPMARLWPSEPLPLAIPWYTHEMSFLWTVETGLVGLGFNDHGLSVYATDISGDGSLIVGRGYVPNPDSPNNPSSEAMYWTDSTGWTSFGFAANFPGSIGANGISDDGSTVIGAANTGDQYWYRWTEETGVVPITDSLHYQEVDPNDVSADGSVIVGGCKDRDGAVRLTSEVCRWNEEGEATGLGRPRESLEISWATAVAPTV